MSAQQPGLGLGALLRAFLPGNLARRRFPAAQRRVLEQLARCGTGELGHVVYACENCGHDHHLPRGCGNRHCPHCQGRLARAWLDGSKGSNHTFRY